jgi:hypothetical protein
MRVEAGEFLSELMWWSLGVLFIGLNNELGVCKAPSRGDRLPTLKIRVAHALEQGAASTCRHTNGLQYVGVAGRFAQSKTAYDSLHLTRGLRTGDAGMWA